MAVTVSTTAMRSWSDIVKGSTTRDALSAKSDGSVSTIAKSWNLCADEYVPPPAVTVSSNFNVLATEFVPTPKNDGSTLFSTWLEDIDRQVPTMNADAKEFTPNINSINPAFLSDDDSDTETVIGVNDDIANDADRKAAVLNASAKEFTPVEAGLGLSEYGQTVEGWQSLAKKMRGIVSAATGELLPVSNLNINSINPAFLSDDDSDTETVIEVNDDMSNDADNESSVSVGNQEGNESTIGSLDEFDGSDVEKEKEERPTSGECVADIFAAFALNSKGKEISEDNQESDKDTSCNESALSWHRDKDSECSSDIDPRERASSVDDSTSLEALSDLEDEDAMNIPMFQVKAPPGLSLPPWKLASGVAKVAALSKPWLSSAPGFSSKSSHASEGDSQATKRPPPWRLARDCQVEG